MSRKNKQGDRGSVKEETIRAKQSNMAESHEDDSSRAVKELSLLEIKQLLISIQGTSREKTVT